MNIGIIPDCWHEDVEESGFWTCEKHSIAFPDYCIWCKLHPDDVYFVNVYEVGRAYGGPEEGGWWYDYGVPAYQNDAQVSFRLTDYTEAEMLRQFLRDSYPDTGASHSVLGGEDYRVVIENTRPQAYPEEIPFYE